MNHGALGKLKWHRRFHTAIQTKNKFHCVLLSSRILITQVMSKEKRRSGAKFRGEKQQDVACIQKEEKGSSVQKDAQNSERSED